MKEQEKIIRHILIRNRAAEVGGQVRFKVIIDLLIATLGRKGVNLLWGPRVQGGGLDARHVNTQVAVDASAADTQERTQVPRRPSRACKGRGVDANAPER